MGAEGGEAGFRQLAYLGGSPGQDSQRAPYPSSRVGMALVHTPLSLRLSVSHTHGPAWYKAGRVRGTSGRSGHCVLPRCVLSTYCVPRPVCPVGPPRREV